MLGPAVDRPLDWAAPGAWRSALATPAFVIGGLAFGIFGVFVANDGGYPATVWYPAALFLLGLFAVAVLVLKAIDWRPAAVAAVGFLAAFTAWSFASITWAKVKGDAWDGANRTMFYLVVYALLASIPWTVASAVLLLGGFALTTVAIGLTTLAAASVSADPGAFFIAGRLSEPMGYQNADAAIFFMAFWPLLMLATRWELPAPLRGLALAAGGVALELALLAQSRASIVAPPATLLVYLVLVPGRMRTLLALVPLAGVVGAAAGTLLDVYPAVRDGTADKELDRALGAVLLSGLVLLAAGWLWAALDSRVDPPPRLLAALRRSAVAAAALGALVAAVLALAMDPLDRTREAWNDFKIDEHAAASSSFARGFSTNRYDLWRVAWGEFERAPLHGIGADNFGAEYVLERRSLEETLYPHSLELRTLTQLGVVGAVLLGGFFLFGLIDALRKPAGRPLSAALAGSAVTVFAYWFIHGSVDWFWEMPGLACPALACLAVAGGLRRPGRKPAPRRPALLAPIAVGAALVGALSLAPPWLAEKEMERAVAEWRNDPDTAFARLERARSLNPLSDEPDMLAGAIASRVDDTRRMRSAFEGALARNSYNWYAQFELGILAASEGNRREALNRLRLAQALDPREPAIALALEQVRSGRKVSRSDYDRLFFERSEAIVE